MTEKKEGAHTQVAAVEKIYAHESLTFNDIVSCEMNIRRIRVVKYSEGDHSPGVQPKLALPRTTPFIEIRGGIESTVNKTSINWHRTTVRNQVSRQQSVRFTCEGTIVAVNTRCDWYCESCASCPGKLIDGDDIPQCPDHGAQPNHAYSFTTVHHVRGNVEFYFDGILDKPLQITSGFEQEPDVPEGSKLIASGSTPGQLPSIKPVHVQLSETPDTPSQVTTGDVTMTTPAIIETGLPLKDKAKSISEETGSESTGNEPTAEPIPEKIPLKKLSKRSLFKDDPDEQKKKKTA
ncbi:hypothetical protein Tco_0992374 [Tanacetum coccineum]|uniref:Uncharacterized protein n=1 Tax=Tanacetum coccineum TaxID=301880 RepID=A0ABQ5F246_9ASTR